MPDEVAVVYPIVHRNFSNHYVIVPNEDFQSVVVTELNHLPKLVGDQRIIPNEYLTKNTSFDQQDENKEFTI